MASYIFGVHNDPKVMLIILSNMYVFTPSDVDLVVIHLDVPL